MLQRYLAGQKRYGRRPGIGRPALRAKRHGGACQYSWCSLGDWTGLGLGRPTTHALRLFWEIVRHRRDTGQGAWDVLRR